MTATSAANACAANAPESVSERPTRIATSMDEKDCEQYGDNKPKAHQRPRGWPRARQQLQKDQSRDAKHDAGDGEHVQENRPCKTGISALVQVVENRKSSHDRFARTESRRSRDRC